jgi:DNA adenine methylase
VSRTHEDEPTRPVLRYHGGKWRLASWVISHFPAHRTYVEPFGGAASVLLRKPRAYAEVYNELDGEIVNVFRVLRDRPTELRDAARLTPFAREEFELSYEPSDDPVEQARRTIFRSMAGFGSPAASGYRTGFRANSNRSHTTPAHDWRNWPDQVERFAERLRGVVIECKPAVEVMAQHDGPQTLHYVDPPYVHTTRTTTEKGYRHEMTDEDHRTLAATLHHAQGAVVLSGYACGLFDELYGAWRCVERHALADGARKRTETLWLNEVAVQARQGVLELGA